MDRYEVYAYVAKGLGHRIHRGRRSDGSSVVTVPPSAPIPHDWGSARPAKHEGDLHPVVPFVHDLENDTLDLAFGLGSISTRYGRISGQRTARTS